MRPAPLWVAWSAILTPVFMIGGWALAAALQPGEFDEQEETVSALAGFAATDPFVMTIGFAVAGVGLVATGVGLRAAGSPGRLLLAVGGVALLLVAVFPLRAGGGPAAHGVFATIEFIALALWPAFSARRSGQAPLPLRLPVAIATTAVLSALLIWFQVTRQQGSLEGLSERILITAELIWPLIVVAAARLHRT
jgi:hypothetical membrane protein